jgi:hypothetical protein
VYHLSSVNAAPQQKATILLEGRALPHRLRIHCVDNLLALHNTDAKTTTLYDIRYVQSSSDDTIVQPIAEGLSIAPFSYEDKPVSLCTFPFVFSFVDCVSLTSQRLSVYRPEAMAVPTAELRA